MYFYPWDIKIALILRLVIAIKIFVECMRKVWYSIFRKGKHPLQSGGLQLG